MADDLLAEFVRADRERELGTYGIHVHREGHEPGGHRFRSDDRVNLYSVAKTFTAVAAGLAEAEGLLSLDDLFLDHFPELRPIAADGFERVTLRQLITMTSGSTHKWFAHMPIDAPDLLHDLVAAPLKRATPREEPAPREGAAPREEAVPPAGTARRYGAAPVTGAEGAVDAGFEYTGSGPYAIGRVIARTSGADLRAYLEPRLFRPLGLRNPAWHTCPLGFPVAESELFLRTEELARFARLLLQGGDWQGRRLIPADFVRRMPRETVPTADAPGGQFTHGYGLGVWLGGNGTYRMDGLYGQYAVIAPDQRAAITVTAHSDHDEDLLTAIYAVLDRMRS